MRDKGYINADSKQYFAFNIWSAEIAKAIINAAATLHLDVVLQTSSNVFRSLSDAEKISLRNFIKEYSELLKLNAYIHLDHCNDIETINAALDFGWDSVMIDASSRSLSENIEITNTVCEIAKKKNALVEAEFGRIDNLEAKESINEIVTIDTILYFLAQTNVDMFSTNIGTMHGLYKNEPIIKYDLLDSIRKHTAVPFVVHGGTGLPKEFLSRLLSYKNIKKINISTEIKKAYCNAIQCCLDKDVLSEGTYNPLQIKQKTEAKVYEAAYKKMSILKIEKQERRSF